MKLPILSGSAAKAQRKVMEFKGLNYQTVTGEGEMVDMKNLSADEYPCLTQRLPRKLHLDTLKAPENIFVKGEHFCVIDGTGFYFDGQLKGEVTAGAKQMTSITDRIVIFPDRTYYDISEDKYGKLYYEEVFSSPSSGDGTMVFSENSITLSGSPQKTFEGIREGDAVEIKIDDTAASAEKNSKTAVVSGVSEDFKTLTFTSGTFESYTASDKSVTIKRDVPSLELVCEYNNRLWGVKGNTIYGSKQGDPFNFGCFQGISTDSYTVEIGTDGDFTGIIGCATHLAVFKQDWIHRLFGSKPSNFQINTSRCKGVLKGAERSLSIIDDVVLYLSPLGVMAYTGNIPELISENFGSVRYTGGAGKGDGEHYYLSAQRPEGNWEFLVYDLKRQLWFKQDDTHALDFAVMEGRIYFLKDDGRVYICKDREGDEQIEWFADFGESGEFTDPKKGYVRFYLHAEIEKGAYLEIEVNADRRGFTTVWRAEAASRKTVKIPLAPSRCDIFQIRLKGRGRCRIYSLTREIQLKGE